MTVLQERNAAPRRHRRARFVKPPHALPPMLANMTIRYGTAWTTGLYTLVMHVITTSDELAGLCARLAAEPFVTVDTEFLRDTTFWPKLCLIQVAGAEEEAIIDPLAGDGLDLAPFYDLLASEAVVKVLHAARQDVEIFFHMGETIPAPLFDTQIAAMVCGFGESVGYETLVNRILDKSIDKSSRFTDWSRRPLTEKQLTYALADVTHLRDIYRHLHGRLEKSGRLAWAEEELAVLTNPATYQVDPDDAWRRLKSRNTNRRFLAVLKEVAAWREREAQSRDVPRGRVLKDDALLDVASQSPRDRDALERLRGVPKGFGGSASGRSLLEAIERGLEVPKDELPKIKRSDPPPPGIGPVVELLRVLLKMKCETHEVAQKLVASANDLERIAAYHDPEVPALSGWRRDVFGADALRLKNGEIALAVKGKELIVIERNP